MSNEGEGSEARGGQTAGESEPWRQDLENLRAAFNEYLEPSTNLVQSNEQVRSFAALFNSLVVDYQRFLTSRASAQAEVEAAFREDPAPYALTKFLGKNRSCHVNRR